MWFFKGKDKNKKGFQEKVTTKVDPKTVGALIEPKVEEVKVESKKTAEKPEKKAILSEIKKEEVKVVNAKELPKKSASVKQSSSENLLFYCGESS